MVALKESLLNDSHDPLLAIMQETYNLGHTPEADLDKLEQAANKLSSYVYNHSDAEFGNFCTQLSSYLEWVDHEGTTADPAELRRLSDEIRLQLIVVAMGVALNKDDRSLLKSFELGGQLSQLVSPIVQEPSGIIHASVGEYFIVLLPKITSDEKCSRVLAELDLLYNNLSIKLPWVIDFSMVEHINGILMANVIYFQDDLRSHGKDLSVSWLRRDILPLSQTRLLSKVMDLAEIGGHFFSRTNQSE